jgi:hypothetical protein
MLCAAACSGGGATSSGPDAAVGQPDAGATKPFSVNCSASAPTADAMKPAGRDSDESAILPGGRHVTPVGTLVDVGGFPMSMRLLPGGKHLVVSDGNIDDEYLSVVDVATHAVVQREPYRSSAGQALFYGQAIRADGHLFVSGGGSGNIIEYSYDAKAAVPLTREGDAWRSAGEYVAGLAFADDHLLVAVLQGSEAMVVIDTRTGAEVGRVKLAGYPYAVAVDRARNLAYVSGWGFYAIEVFKLGAGDPTKAGEIIVGKNPESLLLWPEDAPQKLLATVTDEDAIAVIDLDRQTVDTRMDVRPPARSDLYGVIPNDVAVRGDRLYVASAGDNAVDVFATGSWNHLGRLPAGWYPTAVASLGDAGLAVASGKGLGATPYAGGGGDNTIMRGTLQLVTTLDDGALAAGSTQVEANATRGRDVAPALTCPAGVEAHFALPPTEGLPSPIEHVVFVVRENKTYDENLGDLAGTNGDPKLAMFGEKYTPNLHALARAFVSSDNFYSNAEASIQGHQLTAGGTITDFVEKGWLTVWGRHTRTPVANGTRVSAPMNGYYFQALARAQVDYIDYGEIVGAAGGLPTDKPVAFDVMWPGGIVFNLGSKDVDKAIYFAQTVQSWSFLPHFAYVMLPNNHTSGLEPGQWTPEYMIADNDEATGRIVDAVSHSRFWPSTIVFIIEDDPADGYDHIDAHRSTLVVASPWVKRGAQSHVHYDVPALWRTMEILLGLPPQSQQTATAPPMFDLFTTTPDYTPYTYVPSNIPEARNPPTAKPSGMDFSGVDRARGLGPLLWQHMMGSPPPYRAPADVDDDDD